MKAHEHSPEAPRIAIRPLSAADDAAVRRLAELDSARIPDGKLIGGELDGRLVAAISTTTGELIADPFVRTSELRALLAVRAAQLAQRPNRFPGRRRSAAQPQLEQRLAAS